MYVYMHVYCMHLYMCVFMYVCMYVYSSLLYYNFIMHPSVDTCMYASSTISIPMHRPFTLSSSSSSSSPTSHHYYHHHVLIMIIISSSSPHYPLFEQCTEGAEGAIGYFLEDTRQEWVCTELRWISVSLCTSMGSMV